MCGRGQFGSRPAQRRTETASMKAVRLAATVLAAILVLASIGGSFLSRFDYAVQDREQVNAGPSSKHWLGTDDLGRDRFARLLHGTRVSMLLAPAAAAVSVLLALTVGAAPGFFGGFSERAAKTAIDLFLSIPWLFLLLTVRAMLPLNTSPAVSVTITFLMLGILGWAAPARILLARARSMRQSDFIVMARSIGVSPCRLTLFGIRVSDCLDAVAAQPGIELALIGAEAGRVAYQRGRNQSSGHNRHRRQRQSVQNRGPHRANSSLRH